MPRLGARDDGSSAGSEDETSASVNSDSQSLYEEPQFSPVLVNANNNNTDPEHCINDYDSVFLDCTRGKVTRFIYHKVTQGHSLSEAHFGNPTFWANAYEEIHSLGPHHIVNPFILDFCISTGILGTQNGTEAYYLDQLMIRDIVRNHKVTDKVRGLIAPGTTGALPMRPVLFLHMPVEQHPHFLILLNFSTGQVLVLDQEGSDPEYGAYASWDRWNGSRVWEVLLHAFEWTYHGNTPSVREIDWVKVCGTERHCPRQ